MRSNGDMAMLIELAVLAVLTIGAISTDRYWDRSRSDREEFDRLSRGKLNQ
jgi:hypothetical protein